MKEAFLLLFLAQSLRPMLIQWNLTSIEEIVVVLCPIQGTRPTVVVSNHNWRHLIGHQLVTALLQRRPNRIVACHRQLALRRRSELRISLLEGNRWKRLGAPKTLGREILTISLSRQVFEVHLLLQAILSVKLGQRRSFILNALWIRWPLYNRRWA